MADETKQTLRLAILFHVRSTPTPIRVWAGIGRFPVPADSVDLEGGEYLGLGRMIGAPALNQLINGLAERVEFNLSGVSAEVVRLADSEAEGVRSKDAAVGIAFLDTEFRAASGVRWFWHGRTDTPRITGQGGAGSSRARSVSLSVGTALTGRKRPPRNFFTGIDQRAFYPTDRFCDRASLYTFNTTAKWP